jgi:hypothetical protein
VQGSGIATRGLQAAGQPVRPLEAVDNRAVPDRLGTVLALVVGDLTRSWRQQTRTRRSTIATPVGAVPQPTSEDIASKTVKVSQEASAS